MQRRRQLFLHEPQSYEQVEVCAAVIGEQTKFLDTGMRIPVEFVEGQAISAVFPDCIEMTVAETAPPSHGQVDSTWKSARLINDVEIMVPPFVKSGDVIRLSLSDMKYMERGKAKSG